MILSEPDEGKELLLTLADSVPALGDPEALLSLKEVLLRLMLKNREDAQETLESTDRKIWALEEALRSSR